MTDNKITLYHCLPFDYFEVCVENGVFKPFGTRCGIFLADTVDGAITHCEPPKATLSPMMNVLAVTVDKDAVEVWENSVTKKTDLNFYFYETEGIQSEDWKVVNTVLKFAA